MYLFITRHCKTDFLLTYGNVISIWLYWYDGCLVVDLTMAVNHRSYHIFQKHHPFSLPTSSRLFRARVLNLRLQFICNAATNFPPFLHTRLLTPQDPFHHFISRNPVLGCCSVSLTFLIKSSIFLHSIYHAHLLQKSTFKRAVPAVTPFLFNKTFTLLQQVRNHPRHEVGLDGLMFMNVEWYGNISQFNGNDVLKWNQSEACRKMKPAKKINEDEKWPFNDYK